jgi:hypothetical protein
VVRDPARGGTSKGERRAFLKIYEERYLTTSTLLTSHSPLAEWHSEVATQR